MLLALSFLGTAWPLELLIKNELGIQYYLTQDNRYRKKDRRYSDMPPGYRFSMASGGEFFVTEQMGITFDALGNVLASRLDTAAFKMDRIRYRLAPGAVYELGGQRVSVDLEHDCIHAVDRLTLIGGSAYWTLVRLSFGSLDKAERPGSAGSDHRSGNFLKDIAYSVGAGLFLDKLFGQYTTHQNEYARYAHVQTRYNLESPYGQTFVGWKQEMWELRTRKYQYKGAIEAGWQLPGLRGGKAILQTGYTYLDQNRFDNEHSLWSVGLHLRN